MQLPKFITSFKSTKKKDESSSESAAEQEPAAAAPPRAVPRSIMLFTYASLAGAFITLIISLLDLGYLSFWLNPCASIYTLIYHIGFILIGRRKRVPDNPSYFSTCIFSGYLLALIWFAAFIATIVGLAVHSNPWHQVEPLRQHGLPATVGSQRVQVVLALYELVVVAGMAVKGHSIVLRDGPDPPDWRYQEREDQDVEAAANPPPQMMSVTETVIAEEYVSAYLGD